eukprot:5111885-Pyramimonas_sp.AAC.1
MGGCDSSNTGACLVEPQCLQTWKRGSLRDDRELGERSCTAMSWTCTPSMLLRRIHGGCCGNA